MESLAAVQGLYGYGIAGFIPADSRTKTFGNSADGYQRAFVDNLRRNCHSISQLTVFVQPCIANAELESILCSKGGYGLGTFFPEYLRAKGLEDGAHRHKRAVILYDGRLVESKRVPVHKYGDWRMRRYL